MALNSWRAAIFLSPTLDAAVTSASVIGQFGTSHPAFHPGIEWFDAWPETYSLTNRFHMQRVLLPNGKGDRGGPVWAPLRDVPEDFVEEVRRVITPPSLSRAEG